MGVTSLCFLEYIVVFTFISRNPSEPVVISSLCSLRCEWSMHARFQSRNARSWHYFDADAFTVYLVNVTESRAAEGVSGK